MRFTPVALATLFSLSLAACGGGGEEVVLAQSTGSDRARALAVTQNPTTRVLSFSFGPQNHDAKIIVGPAAGMVTVFGVTGVPDGTLYTNVSGIDWSSGDGTHRLVFEVNQAADFDINVVTATGDTAVDVKWVVPVGSMAAITPSFALATGSGMKKVQVQLESFGRDVAFAIGTNFGAGPAEFKGELQFKQGSVNASGRMDLNFGTGFSKAELLIDSEAQNLNLALTPRFMSELSTKVLSDDPSSSARVSFNPTAVSGGSKIGFEMLSAAPSVALDYGVTGGAGMDEVLLSLSTLQTASVTSVVNANLGQGNDKLGLSYKGLPTSSFAVSGPLSMGGGDDEASLLIEGMASNNLALDCGEGIDKAIGFATSVGCELN